MNKPKPTIQKKLQGNPGGRPLPKDEPQPTISDSVPKPPSYLDADGKKEWKRLAKELHKIGLLTDIDLVAFGGYCNEYSTWVSALKEIQENGAVISAPSGYPILSPYMGIANRSMVEMRKWLIEFGMTPSSRTKVTATKPTGKNPLQEWRDKKLKAVK